MKIKIIVPVATDKWNKGALELCNEIADCETEISISNIEKGPVSIESVYDETYANPFVVDAAKKAEKEGYDGIIIYCFSTKERRGSGLEMTYFSLMPARS